MSIWDTIGAALARIADAVGLGTLLGDRETAFTTGVVALAGKMARADGVVTKCEIAAFRRVFEVGPGEEQRVMRLFDLAQRDVAGADAYAARLGRLFADAPDTREDLIDALMFIAASDGVVHEAELAFLHGVAEGLGVDEMAFERVLARHARSGKSDPYAVLGLRPEASDADVKRAWRALVAEHHPDRAIARGLPPEAVKLATSTLAAANAAYDRIGVERGW
jgi:DnaJ like chaperone protein